MGDGFFSLYKLTHFASQGMIGTRERSVSLVNGRILSCIDCFNYYLMGVQTPNKTISNDEFKAAH